MKYYLCKPKIYPAFIFGVGNLTAVKFGYVDGIFPSIRYNYTQTTVKNLRFLSSKSIRLDLDPDLKPHVHYITHLTKNEILR